MCWAWTLLVASRVLGRLALSEVLLKAAAGTTVSFNDASEHSLTA